ncbi:RcnB family protein [Pseudomonas oryzihabitans]|uniref:RcnB family protein n=1 Tax=Pseudomonas oryzihabitans TaxID=47885 RepID=UPI0015E2E760|nr:MULTISPECIES: RcnB family protein [Pseudomonas]MBA1257841.1 RcnB family protein [Pseudomonas psychrotolerans]HJE69651.1 RcnB family protein [Pseudomonas oryzihabitans]
MIKQSLLSLALGTVVLTGALQAQAAPESMTPVKPAADKAASEPTSSQYQNKVNKKDANQSDDAVTHDPDHPTFELEEGGRAPRKYIRDEYVIKDFKKHGLEQPGEDSQWVKIGSDYVLIKRSNAVIDKIVKAKQ